MSRNSNLQENATDKSVKKQKIREAKSCLRESKRKHKETEYAYSQAKARMIDHYAGDPSHKPPLMANVFDFVEKLRAEPNGRTPFNREIRVEENIVYKTVDGQMLVMDIYYPSRPVGKVSPAVMDIPGGGWMIHNRYRRDGYARCFAALGAVVAVIDHRLCPDVVYDRTDVHFPENLADCIDAYNFLVENADKYGIDKNNITVTGDSSGGHLAACIGCAASDAAYSEALNIPRPLTKPSSLIFISGAFSFDVMYRLPLTHTLIVKYVCGLPTRKAFRSWKYYKYIDPYNFINSDFPPSYNNGGATDFLCLGEAKRMAKKLTEKGVENAYHVGKSPFNCMHCYVLRFPFRSARRDMLKLYSWYCARQRALGVDLSAGYTRVHTFMTKYKKTLHGRVDC